MFNINMGSEFILSLECDVALRLALLVGAKEMRVCEVVFEVLIGGIVYILV